MMTQVLTTLKTALAVALFAGASLGAQAMGPMGEGPGYMRGSPDQMQQRMQERMVRRHTELKQMLKLTAEQEAAWSTFTQAMKPPADLAQMHTDPAEMKKLTTPERLDRMQAMHDKRQARMKEYAAATKAFYAALNPEQKAIFDAQTMRHMGMRDGGGRGMHSRPAPQN